MGKLFPNFDLVNYWGIPLLAHRPTLHHDQASILTTACVQGFDRWLLIGPPYERLFNLTADPKFQECLYTIIGKGGTPVIGRRLVLDDPFAQLIPQPPASFFDWTFYRDRLNEIKEEAAPFGGLTCFDAESYQENVTPDLAFLRAPLIDKFVPFMAAIQRGRQNADAVTYILPYGYTNNSRPNWPYGLLGETEITEETYTMRDPTQLATWLQWPDGWYPYVRGWGVYITSHEDHPPLFHKRPLWTVNEFVNHFPGDAIQAIYPECQTIMVFADRDDWPFVMQRFSEEFTARL